MLENKARPFFAIVIILALCFFSVYLGVDVLSGYFSFNDDIVFSWLSISLIALPIVMIFPLAYFILVLVKGKLFAFKKMDGYVSYLKWGGIAIIILGVIYAALYPKILLNKGYVRCKGIPVGWVAGVATRYVLPPGLCEKKG